MHLLRRLKLAVDRFKCASTPISCTLIIIYTCSFGVLLLWHVGLQVQTDCVLCFLSNSCELQAYDALLHRAQATTKTRRRCPVIGSDRPLNLRPPTGCRHADVKCIPLFLVTTPPPVTANRRVLFLGGQMWVCPSLQVRHYEQLNNDQTVQIPGRLCCRFSCYLHVSIAVDRVDRRRFVLSVVLVKFIVVWLCVLLSMMTAVLLRHLVPQGRTASLRAAC